MLRITVTQVGGFRLGTDGQVYAGSVPKVRLRPLLLPAEHGGWSFIGAPIALGLLARFSWAGLAVAFGALALFFARQPLKIAAKDLLQRKRYPRTDWAAGFGLGFLAVAGFLILSAWGKGPIGLPLGLLGALACVQFWFDATGKGRSFFPEVTGAVAASLFAAIIALAGGATAFLAWRLTAVLAAHSLLAVTYVSARLDLSRGQAVPLWPVWGLALAVLVLASATVSASWAAWPLLLAALLLAGRALWGVSPWRRTVRPQIVGFQETGYTIALVVLARLAL